MSDIKEVDPVEAAFDSAVEAEIVADQEEEKLEELVALEEKDPAKPKKQQKGKKRKPPKKAQAELVLIEIDKHFQAVTGGNTQIYADLNNARKWDHKENGSRLFLTVRGNWVLKTPASCGKDTNYRLVHSTFALKWLIEAIGWVRVPVELKDMVV